MQIGPYVFIHELPIFEGLQKSNKLLEALADINKSIVLNNSYIKV